MYVEAVPVVSYPEKTLAADDRKTFILVEEAPLAIKKSIPPLRLPF